MNKHTPNRWTVTHEMTGIGNRQVWGVVTSDTAEPIANCGTIGEGTARFIVLACNAHADLLAALEWLAEWATESCANLDEETPSALFDARAAIAKARGGAHE